jgi:hypothetical protein
MIPAIAPDAAMAPTNYNIELKSDSVTNGSLPSMKIEISRNDYQ